MPTYKNTGSGSFDTYSTENKDGSLSGRVSYIRPGETFDAVSAITHLKITSGLQAGRFIKRSILLVLQTAPTPSNDSSVAYITAHDAQGNIIAYYDRRQ